MAAPSKTRLNRDQIEAFATGLYYIAQCDGVHERELAVIRDFLVEADAESLYDRLPKMPFDLEKLARALNTEWLRQVFLKSAIVLIKADRQITDLEREALAWIAGYLGIETPLAELEQSVAGERL